MQIRLLASLTKTGGHGGKHAEYVTLQAGRRWSQACSLEDSADFYQISRLFIHLLGIPRSIWERFGARFCVKNGLSRGNSGDKSGNEARIRPLLKRFIVSEIPG
jgi:hypothetical protein